MLADPKRAVLGSRTKPDEGLDAPKAEQAAFVLQYGRLDVGMLERRDQLWTFRYSDAFRSQSDVDPLINFPDVRKVYQARALWPFFAARIPSVAQPKVRETIEKEGLNVHSDADLLRRFGTRSISNPFVLKSE